MEPPPNPPREYALESAGIAPKPNKSTITTKCLVKLWYLKSGMLITVFALLTQAARVRDKGNT